MHNKSFFQGLGIGLMTASAVFLVLYSTRMREEQSIVIAETTEQTTEITTSILDLPDKSDKVEVITQTVSDIEPEKISEINADLKTETPTIPEIEKPTIEMPEIKVPDEGKKKTVNIVIESGDKASDVCHKLYLAGAIDDEKAFSKYLSNHGFSRKVLYGSFDIPEGASYEEIYSIIKSN